MNFVLALAKGVLYAMYRPKVKWLDPYMKKSFKNKPCIFVCNHITHNDGQMAGAILNRFKPYSLVAKDWYDKKLMGFFLKHARTIPIDRFNPDADWYTEGQRVIEKGFPILIFPEGSTAKDGVMKEFKPGAALLAAKMSVPVVPCAIYGEYHKFFGKRQEFIVGKPIEMNCPADMRTSKYAREQTAVIQQAVKKLLEGSKNPH